MPNPGIFKGARKEFLLSQKAIYADAVREGHVAETLMEIQRRYFKRFPVTMTHDFEPTQEELAAVNDNEPDEETAHPDRDTMSDEEYERAMATFKARQTVLIVRKGQLRRWFSYQYAKDNNSKKDSNTSLLISLIQKIYNPEKESQRPRLKAPFNVWRKSHRDIIDAAYEAEVAKAEEAGGSMLKTRKATDRDKIARTLFQALPLAEQGIWKKKAQEEHKAATAKFEEESSGLPPSTTSADRQRAIQSLPQILQPILDAICAATGWKATLIAGGPEPARDGHLSVISVHSGTTSGDVKMHFGQSERVDYKKHIIPIFGSFLQKCYSKEECLSRALHEEEGLLPMSDLQFKEVNTSVHSLGNVHQDSALGLEHVPDVVEESTQSQLEVQDNALDQNPFPYDPLADDVDESRSRGQSPIPSPIASRPPSPSTASDPVISLSTGNHTMPSHAPAANATSAHAPAAHAPTVNATSAHAPAAHAPTANATSAHAPAAHAPTANATSAKQKPKSKKGKKTKSLSSATAASRTDRPKRKAVLSTPDLEASAGTAPPPKKRAKKHSWFYVDEKGRPIDKEGRRIDANGNLIPPERLDAEGNEIVE